MSSEITFSAGNDKKVRVNAIDPPSELNIFGTGVAVAYNAVTKKYDIEINVGAGAGEVNTASNGGLAGVGLVLAKVGPDLPFKAIDAGSSKVTVTNDAVNNTVDIDVVPSNIKLDDLGATDNNTDLNATNVKHGLCPKGSGVAGEFLDSNCAWTTPTGEVATASNQGVGGVGVFDSKVGTDFQFKNINAASSKVSVTNDAPNKEVDIDVVPSNIKLDDLGSPDNNTDLDMTVAAHGLCPKGSNVAGEFLDSTGAWSTPGGGIGEANTASDGGTGGVGLTLTKVGFDLPFKNVIANSSKVAVTDDLVNHNVKIDVTEANLTLSNMGGTLGKAKIPATTVYTDQSNTFGAFAQTFESSQLKVFNPLKSFSYVVSGSAILANRTVLLPLLGGDDQITFDAFATTLTNKTIDASNNTLSNIAKGSIPATTVYTDQSNTFGAFAQTFESSQFKIFNPLKTASYVFVGSAIGANRNVTLPLLTGNDQVTCDAHSTTLSNKTIDGGSNTLSNIAKGSIPATTVYTDQANVFGAFAQTFPNSQLKIKNPAGDHVYTVTSTAIGADRTLTLPLLTGTDQVTCDAHSTTLTNKTINTTDNTVTATSQATGDILKNNGSKFVRLARGTSNQVLRTNVAGTDVEWATFNAENTGTATASGDGGTKTFNVPHSIGGSPSVAFVQCYSHSNVFTYTWDATNIVVTFDTAPGAGSSNVKFAWRAVGA